MDNGWITGDLHFDHFNVTKFCPTTRPFHTKDEMNQALIDHWNSQVKPGDLVYYLGDFCFSGKSRCRHFLEQLNGRIRFILGNHDLHHMNTLKQYCENVSFYETFRHEGTRVVLCHFPITYWHSMEHGAVHGFGHMHGDYQPEGRSMDVGWDNHGRMLTFDEFFHRTMQEPINARR